MSAEGFGELRSALHRAPDEEAWEAVCASLDAMPAQMAREQGIPYAREHLERWPDALRAAPERWLLDALRGRAPDALELARALRWNELLELKHKLPFDAARVRLLAHTRALSGLTRLSLERQEISDAGMLALVTQPPWSALQSLHLTHARVTARGAQALAESALSRALRALNLESNPLDDAAGGALASGDWGALTRLELSRARLSAAGLRALLQHPWPALTTLDLSFNPLDVLALDQLSQSALGDRLASLSLRGCARPARDAPAPGLAMLPLPALRALNVSQCRIVPEHLLSLTRQARLPALDKLTIDLRSWDQAQLATLRDADWTRLHTLRVHLSELDAQRLGALLEALHTPALRTLDLWSNPLGDEGAKLLAQATLPPTLRELNLTSAQLGPDGARALAHAPWLERLERLSLANNPLGDEGVEALAKSAHLGKLIALDLRWTAYSEAGARSLRTSATLPDAIKRALA